MPVDQAEVVSPFTSLNWNAWDPDGDDLTYDIYLGTDTSLVKSDHPYTFYTPTLPLDIATTYYWMVVAKDAEHQISSPTWSFTTRFGVIGLFVDAGGSDCNLNDHVVGFLAIYVFQLETTGATKVRFSAPPPACTSSFIWLSDTRIYPSTTGNSQAGVEITYGSCIASPVCILQIDYLILGSSPSCCFYPVLPKPGDDRIFMTDCADEIRFAEGLTSVINPDRTCSCDVQIVSGSTWRTISSFMGK
ncbi:MAG: hypothetical protein JXB45_11690 [Candidatus Krumholzibacteriota bacterium]|nr:hypothetical protein [Candidatus Krumholzibacteriota bacterium]